MLNSKEGGSIGKFCSMICKFVSQFVCSLGTFSKIVVINASDKLRGIKKYNFTKITKINNGQLTQFDFLSDFLVAYV